MDYFWKELSKVVGPIPVSIKVILEQLRYIHDGLAYLNDEVINAMEEEVKHLPETTGKSDREWQKMIGFNGPLKNFRFVLGERSLLKGLFVLRKILAALVHQKLQKYRALRYNELLLGSGD
nr:uncharacterized protein LOC115258281 [Aedes albopictus]XP_029714221.1 uncharacterized protein LOC109405304 [Aedes albopictus]